MPDNTSRVSMLWPESLKEKVRDRVGSRGLTVFTIEAVEAKLGIHDSHKADAKELNEVKDLAQRLADALAMGGDYEDRASALRLLELPAWIQTVGWPDQLAAIVKPEDSTPEPVEPEPEPIVATSPEEAESSDSNDNIVESSELPAVGDPGTVRSTPPGESKASDLLERIRGKATEKGVDLSGVELKPASSIENESQPEASPRQEEPVATPVANPDVCPKCGTELVNGECWECFS